MRFIFFNTSVILAFCRDSLVVYISNTLFIFLLFLLQLSLCIAKSHLKSYPCPKNFNYLWNQGFLIILAMLLQILTGILLGLHYTSEISNNTDAKGSKRVKIRCQGSIIYTSSNQAIAISKSNNPLNMCLFIILFNYWIAILSISDVSGLIIFYGQILTFIAGIYGWSRDLLLYDF